MIKKLILAVFIAAFLITTPTFADKKWKNNLTVLKRNQVERAVTFKVGKGKVGGTKVPSGTQGGTITEKYYVFSVHPNDNDTNYVYFAYRSTGKIAKIFSGHWGHMNSFHYKWGTNHVIVNSSNKGSASSNRRKIPDSTCFDTVSLKKLGDNYSNCKTKVASNWNYMDGLVPQGEAEYNGNVWIVAWNSGTNDNYIGVYGKSNKKLVKSFKVPASLIYGEAEDIAIDGSTGDVYINFNMRDNSGRIAYFRLDKSAFGNLSRPTAGGGNNNGGGGGGGTGEPGSNGDGANGGTDGNEDDDGTDTGTGAGNVKLDPETPAKCATILTAFCNDAETDGKNTIQSIISFIIGTMTIGIAVLGTIGIIASGYLIMTARDDEAQVRKAKKRILEIVIGIVAWALAAVVIYLLLPTANSDTTKDLSKTDTAIRVSTTYK